MKILKSIFIGLILALGLMMNFQSARASVAGCCVIDKAKASPDNCLKTASGTASSKIKSFTTSSLEAKCKEYSNSLFVSMDAGCTFPTTVPYCSSSSVKGCCINDGSCWNNQTADTCTGTFVANDGDCSKSANSCKAKAYKCGPPQCTSSQVCQEKDDGSYGCVASSTSKCGEKCAQTCKKLDSGKYQCQSTDGREINSNGEVIETNKAGEVTSQGGSAILKIPNPLKYNTVTDLINGILSSLKSIVVVLSLVFIVLGGIMYIISAGDDKRMETAKGMITASLLGLAIAIAAPSFLKEIGSIVGWNSTETASALSLSQIALNALKFLLGIVGVLGIIMMVIGGVMYLISAGDEDRIDTGKKIILYSIIGIAVSLAALVVVRQVASLLV